MKFFKIITLLLTIFLCTNLTAQEIEKEMFKPFGGNTNNCYGNVLMPTIYDTIVEKIEVVAGYSYLKRTPPTYETVTEKILVRPGYTRYEVTEPVFETEVLRISIKEAESLINQSAIAPERTENIKVETAPMIKVWKKTKPIRNCKSKNPERCLTWQVVKVPASSIDIAKVFPATLIEDSVSINQTKSQFITIKKQTLKTEASVKEVNVLPEYKEVTRYIKKRSSSFEQITVPPVYKEVSKIRIVSEGGNIEPREVLCPNDYPKFIEPLQIKLQKMGYDVGLTDGVFGRKSKDALLQYQVKHGLPVGQLDFASLRHLGLIK